MCAAFTREQLIAPIPKPIPESFPLFEYFYERTKLGVQELMAAAGPAGGVLLRDLLDKEKFVIISPSLEVRGHWRATRFDAHGPIGHTEFAHRESALRSYAGSSTESGPPHATAFSHTVEKIHSVARS